MTKSREITAALKAWANAETRGSSAAGGDGQYSYLQFSYRPDSQSPETQLTFRALLVDGRPAIVVDLPSTSETSLLPKARTSAVAFSAASDPPLREPDAICEACQRKGTVGRAVRTDSAGAPTETHRFCARCWPEESARYRARWEEEDRLSMESFFRGERETGPTSGTVIGAATWHSTLEFVREIQRSMTPWTPPSTKDLQEIAEQFREMAAQTDEAMPFEVQAFIHQHGHPARPDRPGRA
jgi:hypothetical protein